MEGEECDVLTRSTLDRLTLKEARAAVLVRAPLLPAWHVEVVARIFTRPSVSAEALLVLAEALEEAAEAMREARPLQHAAQLKCLSTLLRDRAPSREAEPL